MASNLLLVLLGAWIHQAIRVAVLLIFPPQALAKATQSDRLRVAGFGAGEWSSSLDASDRESLESLKRRFFWNFYVFLLIPMIFLLMSVLFL